MVGRHLCNIVSSRKARLTGKKEFRRQAFLIAFHFELLIPKGCFAVEFVCPYALLLGK